MNRKRGWIGAGALLTLAAGLGWNKAARTLCNLAMDRTYPLPNQKRSAKQQAFEDRRKAAAKALAETPHEIVSIPASDGTVLFGHWFPAEMPKRIVLAVHGYRSCWNMDLCFLSQCFAAHDCSVLYIDLRSHGASGGRYLGYGLVEREDLLQWLRIWMPHVFTCEGGLLPVYLYGISMGASTVLMTGGQKLPDYVHGIIADCGYISAEEIFRHVTERYFHVPYGMFRRYVADFYREKLGRELADCTTRPAMETCQVPVLFFHGTADDFVPEWMSRENFARCTAPKELCIVDGAGHGESYLTAPDRYASRLQEFWDRYDRVETAKAQQAAVLA